MALSSSQFESIIKGYERTRDHNRHILEARTKQIYDTIPGYRELDESVSGLSVSAAKLMLSGDDTASERLKRELADIARQRSDLLAANGFPADYLEPIYTCEHCQDTGYITNAEGLKEKCRCFRKQELSVRYAQSNIQDMILKENFSTLSYDYYQGEDLQHFKAAVALSREFVQNFRESGDNLFFYGTVGTGKSFLSGCIAQELLQAGYSVIYFSASGMFERLAGYSFDSGAKEALRDFYEDLYGCDLLIIDDLGTELTNSFVTSQLFSCLNERGLRKKSTVISTNLSLEELRDRYSDRIFSRITSNFSLCKLTGPDIRIFKKRMSNTAAQQHQHSSI